MTLNGPMEGHSIKSTQFVQMASLLLLAVAVSAMLAYRRHSGIAIAVVLALGTVAVPAGWVLTRRMLGKMRQRETEDRLMTNTRTFLQSQEPARGASRIGRPVESDIEILARAIDGSKLPMQDYRKSRGTPAPPRLGDPVVFDALPRRYAIRTVCERRFADLAATLPEPAFEPPRELA
jgi:hypothetical protein